MKLFDKQSLTLLISVVTINVLCIIAVSYAYFTTQIKGNDTAGPITVVMGSMKIKYEDSDLVTLDNAIPGDYLINKFRITNTGTLDASYNLKIDVVENNFRDKGDLEYTLKRNGQQVETGTLPYTDGYILTNITIPSEEIHNYELEVKFKVDEEDKNQNDNKNRRLDFKIVVDSNEEAEEYVYKPLYKDNSGANIPELYQGLIPIYYNDSNQIVIADVTKEWYNYNEHEWANAVLIDHTNKDIVNKFYNEDGTLKSGDIVTTDDILQMYVWIPRYKYQLFNANNEGVPEQMINIVFETGGDNTGTVSCNIAGNGVETCTNASNGEWYTHPAFTFGNTELGGIWVGKFESSDADDSIGHNLDNIGNITILPNKISAVNKTVSTMFNATRDIELKTATEYNLNFNEIDTHMMKNIEWGAVAYLSQSRYGIFKIDLTNECTIDGCRIYTNNTSAGSSRASSQSLGTITGCSSPTVTAPTNLNVQQCEDGRTWEKEGIKASITGTIYGIYDMSGGTWEYVMSNLINIDVFFNSKAGTFNPDPPKSKYYDTYEYSGSWREVSRGHLGDATREVVKIMPTGSISGWNSNHTIFNDYNCPWNERGGGITGDDECGNIGLCDGIFSFSRSAGEARGFSFRVVLTAQDGVD